MYHATLDHIDETQRLYVLKAGETGYTCLGFDVAERRRRALLAWMDLPNPPAVVGYPGSYVAYCNTLDAAYAYSQSRRLRCPIELTAALLGLEGCRVEVTYPTGEKRRFIVGKSTGWMPCHLEIKTKRSTGGVPAYVPDGATVRIIARNVRSF